MPNIEYMTKTDRVLHSIRRSLLWLVVATVVLAIALAGVSVFTYVNTAQSRDDAAKSRDNATKANAALCALRRDREKGEATAKLFLVEHPKGAFGFSPSQIQKSINDQHATILALSNLNC